MTNPPVKFKRLSAVCEAVGLSRSTIYHLMEKGEFPESVPLGANSVAWLEPEIIAWQQARIARRDGKAAEACRQ